MKNCFEVKKNHIRYKESFLPLDQVFNFVKIQKKKETKEEKKEKLDTKNNAALFLYQLPIVPREIRENKLF